MKIADKAKRSLTTLVRKTRSSLVNPYPDWTRLLRKDRDKWRSSVKASQGGPRILIATGVGGHLPVVTLDSLLSVALTLRGAEVHVLLCDRFLPACEHLTIHNIRNLDAFAKKGVSKQTCRGCFDKAGAMYQTLGIHLHCYSEFISSEEVQLAGKISRDIEFENIPGYQLEGVKVGEHALAGALRFFARGILDDKPFDEPVLRHYFRAALLTAYAVRRCMKTFDFRCASFHHGIYVPQGLVGEVARSLGVRVVNWSVAYRKKCFIFSHHDTYHHTLLSEPVESWENMAWTDRHETEILDYLKSRQKGTNDWIWFHDRPRENLDEIVREIGLDANLPCIGMLTNVMWDAQLHYPANAFPNMKEWVVATIRYFAGRPDLQLVIRVHPAELRGTVKSRQLMVEEIAAAFPELPSNVFLIPPESQISTYAITAQCNAVIIYGTKTGVELTSMGIPVIVAGEAWIRNKGLTIDARSVDQYFDLLNRLPFKQPLGDEEIHRARRYAFHFFFRRMIPIRCIEPKAGWPPYAIHFENLCELSMGQDTGLDTLSNGILSGQDFVYPAELLMNQNSGNHS